MLKVAIVTVNLVVSVNGHHQNYEHKANFYLTNSENCSAEISNFVEQSKQKLMDAFYYAGIDGRIENLVYDGNCYSLDD